jgi:solute carrier family 25 protein 34/35
MLAGATAGMTAAVVGSPFFLVKIRMQAQSDFAQIGHQHKYKNTWEALMVCILLENPLSSKQIF